MIPEKFCSNTISLCETFKRFRPHWKCTWIFFFSQSTIFHQHQLKQKNWFLSHFFFFCVNSFEINRFVWFSLWIWKPITWWARCESAPEWHKSQLFIRICLWHVTFLKTIENGYATTFFFLFPFQMHTSFEFSTPNLSPTFCVIQSF